jgi:formate-dependent nitrite reductase membrane component NrfD
VKPYEWMIKFTPQTEWIKRRGVLLWLAFFFIELGAGMFFFALFLNSLLAMLIAWLVCAVLGGGSHLLFLGKPMRFWRIVFSSGWKTSWISRGLVFVSIFLLLGLVDMGLILWAAPITALMIATAAFAFLTIIYGGLAMNYINAIPLWNSALLPLLYVLGGLWGGAEVTLSVVLATGTVNIGIALEGWIRLLIAGFILVLAVYLVSVRYVSPAGSKSVREITIGRWSALFWIGVATIGVAIPLAVVISSLVIGLEAMPAVAIFIAIICGLLGDLTMRYLILRLALYSPLIPSFSYG